jgi:flagellar assembly factor FliW
MGMVPTADSCAAVFHFPYGLPAFEDQTQFELERRLELNPILLLCSLQRRNLRFICAPMEVVSPTYRFVLEKEEALLLGVAEGERDIGESDLLCLAILTLPQSGPTTANLLAPLVLSLKTGTGVQAIQAGSSYSPVQPLHPASPEATPCS